MMVEQSQRKFVVAVVVLHAEPVDSDAVAVGAVVAVVAVDDGVEYVLKEGILHQLK